jgi:hypothetical protein
MFDAVGGEELVKALRARHREVVGAAPDPQQIQRWSAFLAFAETSLNAS